jgi:hypothetical protein
VIGDGPGHLRPFDFSREGFARETLEFHEVRNGPDNDFSIPGFDDHSVVETDSGFPAGGGGEGDLPF